MTVEITRKTQVERSTGAGTDECIGWMAIPAGGVFKGADVSVAVLGNEESSTLGAMIYGLSGYIVPVLDPNTIDASPDTTWDLQVPKDEAIAEDLLDFDYQTTPNTSPNVQVGAINAEEVFNAMAGATKLFKTERVVTFADAPGGFNRVDSAVDTYFPKERVNFRVNKQVRVKLPSVALFALSSPTPGVPSIFSGDVSSWAPRSAHEWMALRYIASAVEFGMQFVAPQGVEAGAHEPFEALAESVGRILEQSFEDTTGAFVAHTIQSFSSITYRMEVPGHFRVKSLRGG